MRDRMDRGLALSPAPDSYAWALIADCRIGQLAMPDYKRLGLMMPREACCMFEGTELKVTAALSDELYAYGAALTDPRDAGKI